MKRCIDSLKYLWILLALPLAASTVRIYAVSPAGGGIFVIDPATNKVVQQIEDIETPHAIDFSPDGTRGYVGDGSNQTLDVLDTKTGKVIKRVPLSGVPHLTAAVKDGKRIAVCINHPVGAVDIVDANSLEKVKTILMKGNKHDCYSTNDGKYVIAGGTPGFVSVIDMQTEQIAWEVPFDRAILTMAIESNPDGSGRRIFVQLGKFDGFAVVDFATHREVERIELPKGGLRSDTGGIIVNGISHGSGITPDGKTYWINSLVYNAVFVYSLPDLKLVGHVDMPALKLPGHPALTGDPHWITFTPDSKTAYIPNLNVRSVVAIDVKTLKVVANIPVGEGRTHDSTLVIP